ncbi:MAG: hypothetical protein PF503_09845 [Desulfobacula sp.]|jgi:hypothetical protein|nr:hypothetical protein [Desulfobacula sp.]
MISKEKTILICRLIQKPQILNNEGMTITHSPMQCFNNAVSEKTGLIIIIFSVQNLSLRGQIIELCSCLKSNSLTKEIPIVALAEVLHRDMLVNMQKAGVESTEMYNMNAAIDLKNIADRFFLQGFPFRIERFLQKLCPFLNYIQIDNQHDLTVCRAYKNRMVLGGKRLHEVCETGNHLHCDYFLNPRTIS